MFREYRERLLRQLSLDYNCSPGDFLGTENVVTASELRDGRRIYGPGRPFLQMATLGMGTVIMADERLHGFLRDFAAETEGHRLFEFNRLSVLNRELGKYGYRMNPTHHMFLPCRSVRPAGRFQVKWLHDGEISPFYGDRRFPNAIAFPEPCPERPDRIAVLAVDGDTVMGMAGCSEDAPHWQQIGIDVLPEFRSKGIGSFLVSLLKERIMETGDVPFYGTAAANILSQNIAFNSGFRPAWTEAEAVRDEA